MWQVTRASIVAPSLGILEGGTRQSEPKSKADELDYWNPQRWRLCCVCT